MYPKIGNVFLIFNLKLSRDSVSGYHLSDQMECGNPQIGKLDAALWISMTQKLLIPHLKALNVCFNFKYQTPQKL